jgi:protein required for attachment to host cells
VYHFQSYLKKLTLIKEIDQPENRLKNRDLTSDRPGHYNKSRDGTRGAYEPPLDAKEVAISNFARGIAQLLNSANQDRLYEKLILITDAHMLGLLKQHLKKSVIDLISQTVNKDLQAFSERDLLDYLIQYID